jgi:hypothetical protein
VDHPSGVKGLLHYVQCKLYGLREVYAHKFFFDVIYVNYGSRSYIEAMNVIW